MSRQLVQTKLPGWDGPRRVSIEAFHAALNRDNYNGPELEANACSKVEGYDRKEHTPRTEDNYRWFWAFYYNVPVGQIAVLIPWSQDWDKHDGSQSDRSPAIYTQGPVRDDTIAELLARLTLAINLYFDEVAALRRYYQEHPEKAPDPGF